MPILRRFAQDESGASIVEYGMLIVGLSLVIVAGISRFGSSMEANMLGIAAFLDETPTE